MNKEPEGHRMPETPCPKCGKLLDTAEKPAPYRFIDNEVISPVPAQGDLTICTACSAILRFGPMLRLEALSEAQIRKLDFYTRAELQRFQRAIKEVRDGIPRRRP